MSTNGISSVMIERRKKRGKGFINDLINKLPIELHLPGYQYCGPGTKLKRRLERGDPGINALDTACKEHDIAYSKNRENIDARHAADRVLQDKAWKRVLAKDANFGEKAAAWGVANVMKAKTKLGLGVKRRTSSLDAKRKRVKPNKKKIAFKRIVDAAKSSIRPGVVDPIRAALKSARDVVKKAGGKSKFQSPRILRVPEKIGGLLPFLIPLFAGLSATGALAGGAAGIAKAVNDAQAAKHQLEESRRHNETMESIALGKGLYLKPYKKGLGLHLKPYLTKNI